MVLNSGMLSVTLSSYLLESICYWIFSSCFVLFNFQWDRSFIFNSCQHWWPTVAYYIISQKGWFLHFKLSSNYSLYFYMLGLTELNLFLMIFVLQMCILKIPVSSTVFFVLSTTYYSKQLQFQIKSDHSNQVCLADSHFQL